MAKILIADDEQLIRKLIGDAMRKDGHEILEAENGQEAYNLYLEHDDINLAVLDIMMPEMDGWQLTRKIRRDSGMPIILVSARSQDFDQIMGFESGADDYVTKPFSILVLKKRIDILLQRGEIIHPNKDEIEEAIEFDGFVMSIAEHTITIDSKPINVTTKEFKIIHTLMQNIGMVYTREQLLDRVWGSEYEGEIRTIDSRVARIRNKLGDWGKKHIITIYGTGYKIG